MLGLISGDQISDFFFTISTPLFGLYWSLWNLFYRLNLLTSSINPRTLLDNVFLLFNFLSFLLKLVMYWVQDLSLLKSPLFSILTTEHTGQISSFSSSSSCPLRNLMRQKREESFPSFSRWVSLLLLLLLYFDAPKRHLVLDE